MAVSSAAIRVPPNNALALPSFPTSPAYDFLAVSRAGAGTIGATIVGGTVVTADDVRVTIGGMRANVSFIDSVRSGMSGTASGGSGTRSAESVGWGGAEVVTGCLP